MANIKSAKKRAIQSEGRKTRNRAARSEVRTELKKARTAKAAGTAEAPKAIGDAISKLDTAARKGIIHPNKAARLKSRLTKKKATPAAE